MGLSRHLLYIGVDPGHDGGIAALDASGNIVGAWVMPVLPALPPPSKRRKADPDGVAETVRSAMKLGFANPDECVVCVEKPAVYSGEGPLGALTCGTGFGVILGALAGIGINGGRRRVLDAKEWQHGLLGATGGNKEIAVSYCNRAWPDVNLILKGKRKAHDGIADALCIAEYGRRVSVGLLVPLPTPAPKPKKKRKRRNA